MDSSNDIKLSDRIITLQKQLRVAIQNYQLLGARKRIIPNRDDRFKMYMDVLKSIILNISKKQSNLLEQYREEMAVKLKVDKSDPLVIHEIKVLLAFNDIPKRVPVYPKNGCSENNEKRASTKSRSKSSNDSDKLNIIKLNGSVQDARLKIYANKKKEANSKTVLVLALKEDGNSVLLPKPKAMQSILKSKNLPKKVEDGSRSPDSISSTSSLDNNNKDNSPSPENGSVDESPSKNCRKSETKLLAKIKSMESSSSRSPSFRDEDFEYIPVNRMMRTRSKVVYQVQKVEEIPNSIKEMDQESFLAMFGLISKAKSELLKKERTGRKRRSVAGQNSAYSDYLQPQPKRSYGPRKSAVPIMPPTSTNAVIVEDSTIDDEEEEKAKNVCILCAKGGELLDVCSYCSETFHWPCIPKEQKGNCPSCMAPVGKISSIVGANVSSGNASSYLELIKRYSNEESGSEPSEEKKSDEPPKIDTKHDV